jgi:putative membrane protein insertion efficiency factor
MWLLNRLHYLIKQLFILPIRIYQYTLSPMLGANCRFQPSCSRYMVQAIEEWGVIKGIFLGLRRIFRCHPWGDFGEDPVPRKVKRK